LASKISSSATSMTLVSGSDKAGNDLSGHMCFIIDEGTASEEFVCGTASSTAISSMTRGLDPQDGKTEITALKEAHRRGASVKVTNFPQLGILSRIMNGDEDFPNIIQYESQPTFLTDEDIITKKYADDLAISGAPDATRTVKGIVEIATLEEMRSGTSTGGTTAKLVAEAKWFATTSAGTSSLLMTDTDGKLDQSWWDLTEDFTFTGDLTASTTILGTTTAINMTVTGDSLLTGTVTFGGATSFSSSSKNDIFSVYGDGHDGSSTTTGNVTLTEDSYYVNLTVESGHTLDLSGYRLFVSGTLNNQGTIHNDGNNANGGTAGATSSASGTLRGGTTGGVGETSNSTCNGGGGGGGGGVVFISAYNLSNAGIIRANGGNGGNGINACSGIASNTDNTNGVSLAETMGGAGGDVSTSSYTGGATTSVAVNYNSYFSILSGALNPLTLLSAGGGTGGAGGNATNNTGSGGGGGGGGGLLWLIYHSASWNTEQVNGGSAGTSTGTSPISEDGDVGTILKYYY